MPDPNWIACYETKITGFVAVFGDLNHAGKYNKSYYLALLGKTGNDALASLGEAHRKKK